jgi:hypothetical protein
MDELQPVDLARPHAAGRLHFLSRRAGSEVQRQTEVGRALTRWEHRQASQSLQW